MFEAVICLDRYQHFEDSCCCHPQNSHSLSRRCHDIHI